MNAWLDDSLVAVALLCSGGYALLALGPKTLRRRIYGRLADALRRIPAHRLQPLAEKFRAKSAASAASGCGGCDNCGPEPAQATPQEIKVPVARVGRRK